MKYQQYYIRIVVANNEFNFHAGGVKCFLR